MSIKFLLTALPIGLLLIVTTSAQTNSDWEKSNGGWIVVKNSYVYNTRGPFHPCPEQSGCNGYPIHVEHGVCINAVTFNNSTIGASWTPPDYNIILAKDCGSNEWMRVDFPVVTKFWAPAGTYTLTEFNYVSEVNPGDPRYSPCSNVWSKTPKTVVIEPGDTVDFGESIFIGGGACTVGGYPCHGSPIGSGFAYIDGTWYMGGPYNKGMTCHITQEGNTLTFINENGQESSGKFVDSYAVVAIDWDNGLRGTLASDGNRIDWANGTWWVRNKEEGFDEIKG